MEKTLSRVLIGNYSELPERLGKTVIIADKEIAVFKLASGKIRAIENRCPHKGGVLAEGMISGEHVFCPMHNWKISVNDGQAQAPDEGCVDTYDVEIKNGFVYVLVNV
ncbi:nitrite reductase (NADH) small subunit [Halobacillus dabanensis]|uniref:Nitrite reductase (NADH) small subunit n=1 Tax=Halobacillus dabanensis TaxID=240302 RepID=A0A1I3UDD7_HALDA|nr:nitrite reductase small subunit NirD [Halobacillus dabanensis]SFJ80942.1 nitrite reductase (NADH) small subunit [Halobacillus dabanensis]